MPVHIDISRIFVQIRPLIEGKTYSGATITKQTKPLELGTALQAQFTDLKNKLYHQNTPIQFILKIEAVFAKQATYSDLQYPQDGKLIIRKHEDNNFEIQIVTEQFKTFFWITKQYPTLEFIRKSYNSMIINFTQFQSMRLAFKENPDREVLGLLLKTLKASSTLEQPIKQVQLEIKPELMEQNGNIEQNQISMDLLKQENTFEEGKEQDTNHIREKQEEQSQQQAENVQNQKPSTENSIQLPHSPQSQPEILQITPKKVQQAQIESNKQQIINSAPPKQNLQTNLKITELQTKINTLNSQLTKSKKQYTDLIRNYNIQKQNRSKLQHQIKRLNDRIIEFEAVKKQKNQLMANIDKLKEDKRFYRNQVTLLSKNLKNKENDLEIALHQKIELMKKLQKYETNKDEDVGKEQARRDAKHLNQTENWRKLYTELQDQNQELKQQIEKLQNSLKTANKKVESLTQQKIIKQDHPKSSPLLPSPYYSSKEIAQKNKTISTLQSKISNLQMLLKYKSGQKGNQSLAFHKIINNLTQAITQKQEQLQQSRKINKELLQKLHQFQKTHVQ